MDISMSHPNATARTRIQECLDVLLTDLPQDLVENIRLVTYEAVANALQANERYGGAEIVFSWRQYPAYIQIKIQDEGGGFDYVAQLDRPMPAPDAFRGRGIPIMRRLSDQLFYLLTDKGTRLYAMWRYRG